MNRFIALALFSMLAGAPAFAGSCDQASVRALLGDAAKARELAPTLDTFKGVSSELSRRSCEEAASERLKSGKDGEWLICYSRVPAWGSLETGPGFGGKLALFETYLTDLRSLDPKAAQSFCDRINECLFELSDKQSSAAYARLSTEWDGLSCPGH